MMDNYLAAPAKEAMGGGQSDAHRAGLDAKAREAGFRNYEEMRAWFLQRQRSEGGTSPAQGGSQANSNFQVRPRDTMAWHPSYILSMISDKFDEINRRNAGN
tara:strand:- start:2483 stop:2788 length:306 start_codon:yes stop_codon:yes gene_type:complete